MCVCDTVACRQTGWNCVINLVDENVLAKCFWVEKEGEREREGGKIMKTQSHFEVTVVYVCVDYFSEIN